MDLNKKYNQWITEEQISLKKLSTNLMLEFTLTDKIEWISTLLLELGNQNISDLKKDFKNESSLECKLQKKWSNSLQDYILFSGIFKAQYQTNCVKCNVETQDSLSFAFNICAIDESFSTTPEFEELTTFFIDSEERELFFFKKQRISLAALIHEFAFLNINSYPLHDEHCLGLCHQCGQNLNLKLCKHQNVN